MPMSNADNPAAEPVEAPAARLVVEIGGEDVTEHVADAADLPKTKKASKTKPEPAPEPELARAFTSGNAEVHNLVAEWEIASSNQDEAHQAAVLEKLAALGYRI